MPQTKRQKQEKALSKLREELKDLESKRIPMQIFRTAREDRIFIEIRNLKIKLGIKE